MSELETETIEALPAVEPANTCQEARFRPGNLVVIRTTGEKVMVLEGFISEVLEGYVRYVVRRPSVSKEGFINHEGDEFYEFELATIEEFGNAQVDEILLKDKIEDRLQEARRESRSSERIDTSIN